MVKNYLSKDLNSIKESNANIRIGRRLREIRKTQGLSQTEFAEHAGLDVDRIRKYENGYRKPRAELLKQMAEVLAVNTMALEDPVLENDIGVMYALFEMEDLHHLNLTRNNDEVIISFSKTQNPTINDYLDEWEQEKKHIEDMLEKSKSEEDRKSIEKEYKMWKWTFPKAIIDKAEKEMKELRREKIKKQIEELQQKLVDLEQD